MRDQIVGQEAKSCKHVITSTTAPKQAPNDLSWPSRRAPRTRSDNLTEIIAHRGSPGLARENTVAAFIAARHLGADGVEFDVRRTSDGELVVHHDR